MCAKHVLKCLPYVYPVKNKGLQSFDIHAFNAIGRDPGRITLARFPRDLFIASKNQTAAHFLVFLFLSAYQNEF
jgi:hypothetical protein